MNRADFAKVMAYIVAATGKAIATETAEVYFDLLGELPAEALQFAAMRALLEACYPVLPPAGVLRKLALDAMNGADREPTADEAWELVRRAINAFGYMREQQALAALPEGPVRRAAECLGWQSMCESTVEEVTRAQYRKAYETLAHRRQRQRLLPAPMIAMLERIGEMPRLPELKGYDHSNACQGLVDEARKRRALPAPMQEVGLDAVPEDKEAESQAIRHLDQGYRDLDIRRSDTSPARGEAEARQAPAIIAMLERIGEMPR